MRSFRRYLTTLLALLLIISLGFVAISSIGNLTWPLTASRNHSPGTTPVTGNLFVHAVYYVKSENFSNTFPIHDLLVSMKNLGSSVIVAINSTNSDGIATMELEPGQYTIALQSVYGNATTSVEIYSGETTIFDFRMNVTAFVASYFSVPYDDYLGGTIAPWSSILLQFSRGEPDFATNQTVFVLAGSVSSLQMQLDLAELYNGNVSSPGLPNLGETNARIVSQTRITNESLWIELQLNAPIVPIYSNGICGGLSISNQTASISCGTNILNIGLVEYSSSYTQSYSNSTGATSVV
jgi:hypothetical protein